MAKALKTSSRGVANRSGWGHIIMTNFFEENDQLLSVSIKLFASKL